MIYYITARGNHYHVAGCDMVNVVWAPGDDYKSVTPSRRRKARTESGRRYRPCSCVDSWMRSQRGQVAKP